MGMVYATSKEVTYASCGSVINKHYNFSGKADAFASLKGVNAKSLNKGFIGFAASDDKSGQNYQAHNEEVATKKALSPNQSIKMLAMARTMTGFQRQCRIQNPSRAAAKTGTAAWSSCARQRLITVCQIKTGSRMQGYTTGWPRSNCFKQSGPSMVLMHLKARQKYSMAVWYLRS